MFGFLKPRMAPEGPVQFNHATNIDRPASEVFPLLDYADERNAKRALGSRIENVSDLPDRYLMRLDLLPDHVVELTVTDDIPGEIYAFEATMIPQAGRLLSSHEAYTVEPLDERSCRLHLSVTATFVEGLRLKAYEAEIAAMSAACHNALVKLKLHAEQGVEAVRAVEAQQMA